MSDSKFIILTYLSTNAAPDESAVDVLPIVSPAFGRSMTASSRGTNLRRWMRSAEVSVDIRKQILEH